VGSFKVGTITDSWTQQEWDHDSSGKKQAVERKLWSKIWYPADGSDPQFLASPYAPYLVFKGEEILGKRKRIADLFDANPASQIFGEAPWLKSHIIHFTKCRARYGAPLSRLLERWPIIVYEHAEDAVPEKNTALCERLASRGYVVFSIYNSDSGHKEEQWRRRQTNLKHLLRRIGAINTHKNIPLGVKLPGSRYFRPSSSPTIIEKLGEGSNFLAERLDVSRGVGLLGHSLGGTTTMLACTMGPQSLFHKPDADGESALPRGDECDVSVPLIACGVALDASMRPLIKHALGASQGQVVLPLMLINSDMGEKSKGEDMEQQMNLVQSREDDTVVYLLTAKGTARENFTDFPWLFATRLPGNPILLPRRWMKSKSAGPLLGPASPHDVWRSWIGMVEFFFDKHLLLPPDASLESYATMLSFNPLFSMKIYSNKETEEVATPPSEDLKS